MGINAKQFRDYVVIPTLQYLAPEIPFSIAAQELLLGTAIIESDIGGAIHQFLGPALGPFQIEVYHELYTSYWKSATFKPKLDGLYAPRLTLEQNMISNLMFSCAMARLYYWRIPAPLPKAGDLDGQWKYYKLYYNTPAGATTEEEYKRNYARLLRLLA